MIKEHFVMAKLYIVMAKLYWQAWIPQLAYTLKYVLIMVMAQMVSSAMHIYACNIEAVCFSSVSSLFLNLSELCTLSFF